MMKRSALFLYFLLLSIGICFGQEKFVPTVAVLNPSKIFINDSLIKREIDMYSIEQEFSEDFKKDFLNARLASNWRTIREKELIYMEKQDFFSMIPLNISRELGYLEVDHRPTMVIYPVKEALNNDLAAYKKLSDRLQVSWIINPWTVELMSLEGKRTLSLKVYLYNVVTHRIYLDKIYTVDESQIEPDGSEQCDTPWICLSQSIQKLVVHDLFDRIEKNIRHNR
jgi:hypothetical protein